jgi:hypothetical protein
MKESQEKLLPVVEPLPSKQPKETPCWERTAHAMGGCWGRTAHAYRETVFLAVLGYNAFLVLSYFSWTFGLTRALAASTSCVAAAFAARGLCAWCVAGCAWAALALGGACKAALCIALVRTARDCGDVSFALAHLEDAGAYADGSKWRGLFWGCTATDMAFFALCQTCAAVYGPATDTHTFWGPVAVLMSIVLPICTGLNFGTVLGSQLLVACAARNQCLAELQHSKGCCGRCCWWYLRMTVGEPFRLAILLAVLWSIARSFRASTCEPV